MAVTTRKSSAKKSKPSKAAAPSVSKTSSRNKRGGKYNSANAFSGSANNSTDEDDTSLTSDAAEQQAVLVSKREVEYSERTWWMVDIEHSIDDGKEGNAINQGATPLVKRCMRV
eukprot:CAMPEP_0183727038 /NCGR_PEP_ID=MMETSP0737-20130205/24661_1 /TAXON_ID=385413 /ORGANISM="Thalassiosira miniscula, Strain CCMP1093" /LENGTH=113 /DNA_ID=CAMNT_0025958555 /DNA_START=195 /DNA_END=536 /DNA_ORIENTATION=-